MRKEQIIQMANKGFTYEKIGELLGLSKQRIHQIVKGYKNTPQQIKKGILDRDENQCVLCQSKNNIHVHHIDKNKNNNEPKNLMTLCIKCHNNTHTMDKITKEKGEDNRLSVRLKPELWDIIYKRMKVEKKTKSQIIQTILMKDLLK